MFIEFGTILAFRNLLGVVEHVTYGYTTAFVAENIFNILGLFYILATFIYNRTDIIYLYLYYDNLY